LKRHGNFFLIGVLAEGFKTVYCALPYHLVSWRQGRKEIGSRDPNFRKDFAGLAGEAFNGHQLA
jgi:hypothetical protein